MRRESKAGIAERDRVFDRIKELAPAQVVAPNVRQDIVMRAVPNHMEIRVVQWRPNQFIILQRLPTLEIDDDEDADRNAPARRKYVVAEQTFDHFIFGSLGGRDLARAFVEAHQTQRIQTIVRQHHLNADQEKKLVLAARGDRKRIFDQVDDARKQFMFLRTDPDRCQHFLQDLQPVDNTVRQRLFDAGSLFAKTLKKISEEIDHGRSPK
jgi:hypothetical protein